MRLTLLMAIDLLMQNGRTFVEETEHSEIVAALKNTTKNYMADVILDEIVNIAKELAPLRTCKLLEYVKRSDLDFKKPGAPDADHCPICGDRLEYLNDEPTDNGGIIDWECPCCGATGQIKYSKLFEQHYNVHDNDGNPFPAESEQVEDEN